MELVLKWSGKSNSNNKVWHSDVEKNELKYPEAQKILFTRILVSFLSHNLILHVQEISKTCIENEYHFFGLLFLFSVFISIYFNL